MTDRELLELAAKAAGMPHQWCDAWNTMAKPRPDGGFFFDKVWNPLTDDGDALRLAVKLRIAVDAWVSEACAIVFFHGGRGTIVERHYGDDPYAATRRAIVRAAAEIGRGMP
jgi:hypothetical protein